MTEFLLQFVDFAEFAVRNSTNCADSTGVDLAEFGAPIQQIQQIQPGFDFANFLELLGEFIKFSKFLTILTRSILEGGIKDSFCSICRIG